jgi:hypothetical protein
MPAANCVIYVWVNQLIHFVHMLKEKKSVKLAIFTRVYILNYNFKAQCFAMFLAWYNLTKLYVLHTECVCVSLQTVRTGINYFTVNHRLFL